MEFRGATTSLHCSQHTKFVHLPSSRIFLQGCRDSPKPHLSQSKPGHHLQSIRCGFSASFDSFCDEYKEFQGSLQKQWQGGFMQAGETAYCSVKKALSSTLYIILELHSYALQMRELQYYEDLQEILQVAQKEIHASFVWLFQKVFSHTPTLMMYVMIFLANYTVYSISSNASIFPKSLVQIQQIRAIEDQKNVMESSMISTSIFLLSNGKKTMSIGGTGGDGGKHKPVGSDTDGDDRFIESNPGGDIAPNEEPLCLKESFGDNEIQPEDFSEDHLRTELLYQMELAQEPNNPLLLANFAQFLYVVAKDFDRAEEYFKRATNSATKDAETLNKYARFLWVVKNDIWAAEEMFLEAIEAEPHNPFYAAEYAHFLWNTGGEDTCFPLS